MNKKRKSISGLRTEKIKRKRSKYFSETEKHVIIQEMLSSDCTKREIWRKHTGQDEEHGQLLRWMRQLGYDEAVTKNTSKYVITLPLMKKHENLDKLNNSPDNTELKKRITELEKQLQEAEMKAIAFSTMVDVAEQEFKISIRKKPNTKPLM
jgi:transposase-like protein